MPKTLEEFAKETTIAQYLVANGFKCRPEEGKTNGYFSKGRENYYVYLENDYFRDVNNPSQQGNLEKLIRTRTGNDLGRIEAEIEAYKPPTKEQFDAAIGKGAPKFDLANYDLKPFCHEKYLNGIGISTETVNDPLFKNTVYTVESKVGEREMQNTAFVYHNRDGEAVGLESVNFRFSQFATGSKRGESLYLSNDTGKAKNLYVMNQPTDCLAFRQLYPEMENIRFAATGGIPTAEQVKLCIETAQKTGAQIVLSFENTIDGAKSEFRFLENDKIKLENGRYKVRPDLMARFEQKLKEEGVYFGKTQTGDIYLPKDEIFTQQKFNLIAANTISKSNNVLLARPEAGRRNFTACLPKGGKEITPEETHDFFEAQILKGKQADKALEMPGEEAGKGKGFFRSGKGNGKSEAQSSGIEI